MSLRSSSQQPPVMSNTIGSSRESNPSRRICHLRAVPLGHVADTIVELASENGIMWCQVLDCGIIAHRLGQNTFQMYLNTNTKHFLAIGLLVIQNTNILSKCIIVHVKILSKYFFTQKIISLHLTKLAAMPKVLFKNMIALFCFIKE